MNDVMVQVFVLAGSIFILLAGIGLMRMPDLYMRMSTVTKAGTLGVGLILIGAVIDHFDFTTVIKAGAVITFGFLTSPVAAHMISRAAYFQGVRLWEGSVVDELRGQYEDRSHQLSHPAESETIAGHVLEHDEDEAQTAP